MNRLRSTAQFAGVVLLTNYRSHNKALSDNPMSGNATKQARLLRPGTTTSNGVGIANNGIHTR
jgi:hypothetical protein